MSVALRPGDVLLADSLFDNDFLICELRRRGIDVVVRAQYRRAGSQVLRDGPDGEILLWRRPNKPHGMTGAQYRLYPEVLLMRQVTVDARDKEDRAERFRVVTTILDASIDGAQIGDLYERRWEGEVCQADCISRYSLYRSCGAAQSGRRGAAGTGTMESAAPTRPPRRTVRRRHIERLCPPPARTIRLARSA
jgi:hypothetical protein